MDDELLRLEFGDGALKREEVGALFRSIGTLCNKLFGDIDAPRSFRDCIEVFNINGEYAKVSRLVVRSLGSVIGFVVGVEYFSPTEEIYNEQTADLDDEDEDEEEDDSFVGRYVTMNFDSTDTSFYKTESLAKLHIDYEGAPDIEEVGGFYVEEDNEGDAFGNMMEEEAKTLTIDDYFIINTVKLIIENKNLPN